MLNKKSKIIPILGVFIGYVIIEVVKTYMNRSLSGDMFLKDILVPGLFFAGGFAIFYFILLRYVK
ncbi:hypothetical protein IGI75_003350 [Enterococcus sp. DIV2469a]